MPGKADKRQEMKAGGGQSQSATTGQLGQNAIEPCGGKVFRTVLRSTTLFLSSTGSRYFTSAQEISYYPAAEALPVADQPYLLALVNMATKTDYH